jgi:hypothetical protein
VSTDSIATNLIPQNYHWIKINQVKIAIFQAYLIKLRKKSTDGTSPGWKHHDFGDAFFSRMGCNYFCISTATVVISLRGDPMPSSNRRFNGKWRSAGSRRSAVHYYTSPVK